MFDSLHIPPVEQIEGLLIPYSMFATWGNLFCEEASSCMLFLSAQRAVCFMDGILYVEFTNGFYQTLLYPNYSAQKHE